jgi:hypothetical protein
MPFPLSIRQSNVFVQAFNNLEVDGTMTYVLSSIDTKSGEDRKVPQHIKERAAQYLKEKGETDNKKTVSMDIKLLCGEFKFIDKNTFTLAEYSSINVNSFSLPKTFNKMFIKSFVNGKFTTMNQLFGANVSKKGYKGSEYEKVILNIKNNKEYQLY